MTILLTMLKMNSMNLIGICFIVVLVNGRPAPVQKTEDTSFEVNLTTSNEYIPRFTSNPYYRTYATTPRTNEDIMNDYTTEALKADFFEPYKQFKMMSTKLFDYNEFKLGIPNYSTDNNDPVDFFNFLKSTTESNLEDIFENKNFNTVQLEDFLNIIKKKAMENLYMQQPTTTRKPFEKRSAAKASNETEDVKKKCGVVKHMYNKIFRSSKKNDKKDKPDKEKNTTDKQDSKKNKSKCGKCGVRRSTVSSTTESPATEYTTVKDSSTEEVVSENDRTTTQNNEVDVKIATEEDGDSYAPSPMKSENTDSGSQNLTLPRQNSYVNKHSKNAKNRDSKKKHMRHIPLKHLTSPSERFLYKRQLPEMDYENTVKILPKQDITVNNITNFQMDSDSSADLRSPFINAALKNGTTEALDLGTLTQKLHYTDYINGYKYYLNYQRELGKEKFSDLVKYQAHRHHNVDDIGKFILDKLPPIPTMNRYKRDFLVDDSMDDQDLSTRSDDTWFKKHFYLFINTAPTKNVQSESLVEQTKAPLQQLSAKSQRDNLNTIAFDDTSPSYRRDERSIDHTSALLGSDTSFLTGASVSPDAVIPRNRRDSRIDQSKDNKKKIEETNPKPRLSSENKRTLKHKGFFRKFYRHKKNDNNKINNDRPLRRSYRFIGLKNLKNLLYDSKMRNPVLTKPTYMDYLMRSSNEPKTNDGKFIRNKNKYNIPNADYLKSQVPNITGMAPNEVNAKQVQGSEKYSVNDKSMEDKSLQNTNSPSQYPSYPSASPLMADQPSSYPDMPISMKNPLDHPSTGSSLDFHPKDFSNMPDKLDLGEVPTLKSMTAEPDAMNEFEDTTYSKEYTVTEDLAASTSELWSMTKSTIEMFQYTEPSTTFSTYPTMETDNMHGNSIEGYGSVEDVNTYNNNLTSITTEAWSRRHEIKDEPSLITNSESAANSMGPELITDGASNEMVNFDRLIAASLEPWKRARAYKYRHTKPNNNVLTTGSKTIRRVSGGNKRNSNRGYVFFDTTLLSYDDGVDLITESLGLSAPRLRELSGHKSSSSRIEVHSTPPKQFYTTPIPMKGNEFNKFLKENNLEVTPLTNSVGTYSLATEAYAKVNEQLSAKPTKIIKMDKVVTHTKNIKNNLHDNLNVFRSNDSLENNKADNSYTRMNQNYESYKRSPYDFFESKEKYPSYTVTDSKMKDNAIKIVNYPVNENLLSMHSTRKVAYMDKIDKNLDMNIKGMHDVLHGIQYPKVENTQFNLDEDLDATTISMNKLKKHVKDIPYGNEYEMSRSTPFISMAKEGKAHSKPNEVAIRNHVYKFDIVLRDVNPAKALADDSNIYSDHIINRKQRRWKRKSKRHRRFGTALFSFWGKQPKESVNSKTTSDKNTSPTTSTAKASGKPSRNVDAVNVKDKSKSNPVSDNNTMILLESNDVTTNPPGDVDEMISRSTKTVMDKLYGNKNKSATNNVSIFRKLLTADIKIDKDINLDDIENMEKELNVKQSLFRSVVPKLKLEAEKSEIKPIEQKTVTIPVKQIITKKKLPKNHKVKRTASFTTFTAKDVSELELVIEVQKKCESADVDKNKKRDLHLIVNSLSEKKPVKKQIGLEPVNLSSSKVYIVVTDSPNTGSKSLNEPVKQRKVLSAIMSTPVDILYQIHAYDNISQEPYVFNTQSATEISNGIYLIIQRGGKIVLNPVQEITEPYSTQTHYTSTDIVKAKDIVYAVEEKLNKIYDIIMTNNNQNHNVRARAAKFFTMPKVTSPMRSRKDDDYGISSTFRNLNENQFTTESDEISYTDFVPVTQPKKYNINVIGTVIKGFDATTQSKPVTNSQSTKKLLPEIQELSTIYSKNITEKHKIMSTPKFTSILSADAKSQKDKENTDIDESNLYPNISISKMTKTEQIADKDMKNKLESIIDKLSSVTKDIFEHSLEINDAVLDFSEQTTKYQKTMTLEKLNITEPTVFYIPSSSTPATIFSTFTNITNKDDILERLVTLTNTGISVTNQPIDNVASKGKLQNVMNALLTYNKDKSKIPIATVKTPKAASTTKKPKKNETKKKGKDEKLNSVQRVGPDNKRKLVTKSKMKMTSGKMSLDGAGQTILKKEKTSTTKAPIATTTAISFPTEAPQSVPGNLNMVCDLPATYRNIELLHEKLPRQEFANIMKHMNCSRYKEPPRFFLLTCKKKKNLKEQINKQRKFMKHLKWDWIREKRSLSITPRGDSFDANDYSSGQYNLFKVYLEQDNDFFEEFVKDRHGIFRGKCNERKKRKSSRDPDKTDELYVYYGDTVIIDCMTMPGIPKPGMSNDFTILWETEDKELTETDNSGVLGSLLVIEDTNPKNDGIYLCKSKGVIKRIKVTVVALPVLNIIFTPLYAANEKCSDILMDVIALKKFESDMETYVCPSKKHCNITIHKPFCFTDRLSNASHLKAMIVVTLRPPTLACNTECKRDLYAGLCNLTIANIPLILKTPLILSSYEGNITLKPVPKEDISGGVAHALIREAEPVSNKHLNFAVKMHPGDIQTIFTCSAGYFLIPQENICASCPRNTSSTVGQNICLACPVGSWAPPGAASCIRIIKNGRCSHWWFNPSLTMHYVLTSLLVTTACACCVAAVSRRRRGDSRTISPRQDLETGQQKTATTADNMPGLNQLCYSGTCYKNKSRPLSPSRVILARLFSSPPRSRDDSQNKFEIWKERNSRPPVPPVDFDY